MIRRDFMRRLVLGAAGLLVADDALELLLEPRRRFWPGHDFGKAAFEQALADYVDRCWEDYIWFERLYVQQIVAHRARPSLLRGITQAA